MIDGDAVIHEIVLPAPVEQVFDMFTDPRQLIRWIGISADLQPRPGGRFRFEVMPGQFCEGQYVIVERPGRLIFTWGWTDPGFGLPPGSSRVEVTLTRSGDDGCRTRLRLVHTGLAGDLGLLHEDGWSRFLGRLTAAAAGEQPAAYPSGQPGERLAALHRHYRTKESADEPGGAVAVDVLTEIVITRPAAVVAAYAADPSNAPAWYGNITSVTWETSPPLQAGSRIAFTARFLGRRLAYTYEITDFSPPERLVMRTAQGPFPMETTYTWRALDDRSTRMTLRNRGEPAGFPRLAAPMMAIAMRRANRKDLRALRAVLEAA